MRPPLPKPSPTGTPSSARDSPEEEYSRRARRLLQSLFALPIWRRINLCDGWVKCVLSTGFPSDVAVLSSTKFVRLQNFCVVSHLYKRHKWKWGRANQSRIGDRFPYSV